MRLNFVTLAVFAVFAVLLGLQVWGVSWTATRIAGIAIAAPAFLLFVLARIQLGRAFSVRAKASTLVTTGIYSRIRNPIYMFGGLTIAGAFLLADRPWLLLIFAVLIPMQVFRIRQEERVLEEKFGAEYVEYRRRTWF